MKFSLVLSGPYIFSLVNYVIIKSETRKIRRITKRDLADDEVRVVDRGESIMDLKEVGVREA